MRTWIDVPCQQCGKMFTTYPSRIEKGEGKFCSRSCGSKHSHSLRPPAESKSRLSIKAREEYIKIFGPPVCMMCGSEKADVHHRDHNRKNNDPKNLQALCRSCHVILHNQERVITDMEAIRSNPLLGQPITWIGLNLKDANGIIWEVKRHIDRNGVVLENDTALIVKHYRTIRKEYQAV